MKDFLSRARVRALSLSLSYFHIYGTEIKMLPRIFGQRTSICIHACVCVCVDAKKIRRASELKRMLLDFSGEVFEFGC